MSGARREDPTTHRSVLLPGALWVGLLALGGCARPGTYSLASLSGNPDQRVGELDILTEAKVDRDPTKGWDLTVRIDLDWRGQERSRVDLTRAVVKVDALPWENCRPHDQVDRNSLIVVLEPGDRVTRTLHCRDIPQPHEQLVVRIHATGTGAPGGYIELQYHGLD